MAREKTVYTSDEIPHLWATHIGRAVRNPTGNHSARNDGTLYSYSEMIGRLISTNHKGKLGFVALFRDASWSMTTNRHQSGMRQAARHLQSFTVPDIGQSGGWTGVDHKANLDAYARKIAALELKASKARQNREWHIREATALAAEANAYAKEFGSRRKFKAATAEEMPQVKAKHAKAEAARVARDKAARKAREEREAAFVAERAAKIAAELPQWQAGTLANFTAYPRPTREDFGGTDLMRMVGDDVQTSQGARVAVRFVARALRLILPIIDAGRTWETPPDKTIRVGDFTLRSIDASGTVVVGCHSFSNAEVRRIAVLLQAAGVVPATDDR